MIFVSAGHNSKAAVKPDPGAMANGYKEGDLAIEFRDLVCVNLRSLGVKYITDTDNETLKQYLTRINTGQGSVVIEYHFDAGSVSATGSTSIVGTDADRLDRAFASDIVDSTAEYLNTRNRGIITEAESHRGRLGLIREQGIVCLCELCFITNVVDMDKYFRNKNSLAHKHATILKKYDDLIL